MTNIQKIWIWDGVWVESESCVLQCWASGVKKFLNLVLGCGVSTYNFNKLKIGLIFCILRIDSNRGGVGFGV